MEVFIGMSHEQELNGKGWDASAFPCHQMWTWIWQFCCDNIDKSLCEVWRIGLCLSGIFGGGDGQATVAGLDYPMGGCAQHGKAREAIDLFHKFHSLGLKPSEGIFSSILRVFTDTVDVEVGHNSTLWSLKWGSISFILIGNAILDFHMWVGIVFGSLQTGISMHSEGLVCFSLQSF